jgi:hypothetical protein
MYWVSIMHYNINASVFRTGDPIQLTIGNPAYFELLPINRWWVLTLIYILTHLSLRARGGAVRRSEFEARTEHPWPALPVSEPKVQVTT